MKGAARVLEIIQDRTTARASRPLDMPRSRRGPENVLRATPGDVREQHQRQPEGLEAYGEAKREPRARRCGVPCRATTRPGGHDPAGLAGGPDRCAAEGEARTGRTDQGLEGTMDTKPHQNHIESADAPAAGLDVGRLGGLLGFHLRMAHVAVYRDFAETMAELGLTQKQLAVMELLEGNPGSSQIDLANTLGTDRATMMALVNRLASRDLIERQPSVADRRRQELHLTKAGTAILAQARKLIDQHEQRFTALFGREEMDALLLALKRIYTGH
jgi:DNA-binding MarR family transcriptional regulator